MKQMQSRFDGWCRTCRRNFSAGTDIFWAAGQGSTHVSCPPCMDCAQVLQADGTFTHKQGCPTQAKDPNAPKHFAPGRAPWRNSATRPVQNVQARYDDALDDLDLRGIEVGGRGKSYFAIPFDGEGAFDGHLFLRVDKPDPAKDPRWGGNVFVRWIYGETEKFIGRQFPSEGYRSLRDYSNRFEFLLNELAADPEKYKALYGQRVGKCGHCHKRLTDAESRARGIGPECFKNVRAYQQVPVAQP